MVRAPKSSGRGVVMHFAWISKAIGWIADRWIALLAVLAVVVGVLFGNRAERKAERAAVKVGKATGAIERARKSQEDANEILREAQQETADREKEQQTDPAAPGRSLRDRVRAVNRRMLDDGDR